MTEGSLAIPARQPARSAASGSRFAVVRSRERWAAPPSPPLGRCRVLPCPCGADAGCRHPPGPLPPHRRAELRRGGPSRSWQSPRASPRRSRARRGSARQLRGGSGQMERRRRAVGSGRAGLCRGRSSELSSGSERPPSPFWQAARLRAAAHRERAQPSRENGRVTFPDLTVRGLDGAVAVKGSFWHGEHRPLCALQGRRVPLLPPPQLLKTGLCEHSEKEKCRVIHPWIQVAQKR